MHAFRIFFKSIYNQKLYSDLKFNSSSVRLGGKCLNPPSSGLSTNVVGFKSGLWLAHSGTVRDLNPPQCCPGLIDVELLRWSSSFFSSVTIGFLVTSLTKALLVQWRPTLGRVLVVSHLFHLRVIEATGNTWSFGKGFITLSWSVLCISFYHRDIKTRIVKADRIHLIKV